MTRYGFAIKALPKGGKPFGEEDDDENAETEGTEEAEPESGASSEPDPFTDPTGPAADDPEAVPDKDLAAEPADPAASPPADAPPAEEDVPEDPAAAPPQPTDDGRPWAGDMYDEGDETQPDAAFAAYTGGDGEQAWLDQAPDGTLTGWVRDATGQVWRYTDADAWATDVDGAQMTRTHGPEGGTAQPSDPSAPMDPGVQEPMFASQ